MTSTTRRVYEFGDFRLDPAERLLTRNNQPVELPPKAFDILVVLVERHGRLVRKDEFLHDLWRDTFVEEGTLKRHISALRKTLGENGENGGSQRYIETLPKAGYRFAASVTILEIESPPANGSVPAGNGREVARVDEPAPPDAARGEAPLPREPANEPVTAPVPSASDIRRVGRRSTTWAVAAAAVVAVVVIACAEIFRALNAPSVSADVGVADYPKRLTNNLGSDDFPDWS